MLQNYIIKENIRSLQNKNIFDLRDPILIHEFTI